MQIANVKQRQILPRVGKIWARTPQNCATTNRATFENGCPLKVYPFVVMRFIASLWKSYYRNCQNYTINQTEVKTDVA